MSISQKSIINYLLFFAEKSPDKPVFTFLKEGGGDYSITYAELLFLVRQLSGHLSTLIPAGSRVFLIYQEVNEFIIAFLSCQYLGVIPVPIPFIKGSKLVDRLITIQDDVSATAILCTNKTVAGIGPLFGDVSQLKDLLIISSDKVLESDFSEGIVPVDYNQVSFLQYTSGSTGNPKGVIVSVESILHNQQLLQNTFGCNQDSIIFSWLPFHHDMGLIGNILHTVFTGATCILMSPLEFIQTPLKWLENISKYRVTHSGGPNFAYELCLAKAEGADLSGLDLSSWKTAYNGAEPVLAGTLTGFIERFEKAGFDGYAFYPCYGLAEATLLVSGDKSRGAQVNLLHVTRGLSGRQIVLSDELDENARSLVSCGLVVAGMKVQIFLPDGDLVEEELFEAEVCISGESVTDGYWNKPGTDLHFYADGVKYLRTGDLGFFYKNELFISGRIKEMIIINGQNIYPADIENVVFQVDEVISHHGVVAFHTTGLDGELVIAVEINRTAIRELDGTELIGKIDRVVNAVFNVNVHDILLIYPLGIPRTTSGKLKRTMCKELYRDQPFKIISSKRDNLHHAANKVIAGHLIADARTKADYGTIRAYLLEVIRLKTGGMNEYHLLDNAELTEIGLDSLRAMELMNTINKDMSINIDASMMFQMNTLFGLITTIENLLWLKNEQSSGKELII